MDVRFVRTPPRWWGRSPARSRRPSTSPPRRRAGWRVTNARSTRRRVTTRLERTPVRLAVELGMLYHNGYAQDEGVGHLTDLARKRGYQKVKGRAPGRPGATPTAPS
ncbi:MAG: hypothetical protein R3F43_19090 [bacterium]